MFEALLAISLIGIIYLARRANDVSRRITAFEANLISLETKVAGIDEVLRRLEDGGRGPLDVASPKSPEPPPIATKTASPPPMADSTGTASTGMPSRHPDGPDRSGPPETTENRGAASVPLVGPGEQNQTAARAEPGLEERLGTRWAVYLGGIAIALGGTLLVKHAIDMGLLGPGARIVLGLLLGAGLVALGTYMRLREVDVSVAVAGGAHIPSVLTAAGTMVLFATTYAAYALYGFIDSGGAFLALGAVGLATMVAAAIHGPSLAGLGLAGAYVTPLLVSSVEPNPWALVSYLAVVSFAALQLGRIRQWLWLIQAAMTGIGVWSIFMIAAAGFNSATWSLPLMVHLLAQSAIASGVMCLRWGADREEDEDIRPDRQAGIVLAVVAALSVLALLTVPYSHPFHLAFSWAIIVLLAATAWHSLSAAAGFLLAGIVATFVLANWPGISDPIDPRYTFGDPASLIRLPENLSAFLGFAVVVAAGIAGSAIDVLWRRARLGEAVAGLAALAATLTPLAVLAICYLRITQFGTGYTMAAAAAVIALLFAWLAERFLRREQTAMDPAAGSIRIATGAFAAAAISALAIALVAALQHGYLTVAFALTALGTAFVANRRDIPVLRTVVAALGFVVLARLVWDPLIVGEHLGRTPIFNWLLVGYGVPAIAFAAAGQILRKPKEDTASRICDALAILFTALLFFFQIRHYVHAGDVFAATTNHLEAGLMATVAIALSYTLWIINTRQTSAVWDGARTILAVASAVVVVLGLSLGANPYFTNQPITGGLLFNTLVPAYLLPGLLALFVARHTMDRPPEWYSPMAASEALVLVFLYVTLAVRHGFHGVYIGHGAGVGDSEMWSYTVAWLVLAIVWLGYGLVRGSLAARAASGVLLAITIAKVALFDLSGVTGVWRALSFLCLGAVLIAIGLVYQKLVFAGPGRPPKAPPEP